MKHRYNVLLVEDSIGDAYLIQELMAASNMGEFLFTHVELLADAVNCCQIDNFDLILLDLNLPDSSGLETVEMMCNKAPAIPIVVFTSKDDEAIGIAAAKFGVQDYLVKGSFTEALLARVIVYAIERQRSQESLRQSEQFLRTTLDSLSANIAILDRFGEVVAVNRAWEDFSKDNQTTNLQGNFVGSNYLEVCDQTTGEEKESASAFAAGVRAVIDGSRETFGLEYPCDSLTEKRWFYGRVTPFPGERLRKVVVAHEDVTEQRRAKEALKESEIQLRLVLNTTPNCISIQDNEGRYVLVNKPLSRLFGLSRKEMIGKKEQELQPQGFVGGERRSESFSGTSSAKGFPEYSLHYDTTFTSPDGKVQRFYNIKRPIAFSNYPDSSLNIAINVTAHWQMQEELRNSELRLQTILDAQLSKVVLLDKELTVLWPNKKACQEAKLPCNEIIGRHCWEVWGEASGPCEVCSVKEVFKSGKPFTTQTISSSGNTLRVHGFPVRDDTGEIVSAVEVVEDISELVSLEGQLRQAQKMESLGTLAGGIAHDFNNILSGILGYTELALEKTVLSEDVQDYLGEVFRAGLRATELTRQILTFSRRADIKAAPLMVSPVVQEALKLLRSTLPTTIEIKAQVDKNLEYILGDPTQIHQIIMNLCTNASHAMEPYGGVLEVNLKETQLEQRQLLTTSLLEPGRYLELSVEDNGCGMSQEIVATIFDPYFTTKDLGEGTGLGLSLVHGIVSEYGGGISVESAQGEGSTFRLFFPVIDDPAKKGDEMRAEAPVGGTERILVVDDEPGILKLCSRILQNQGYQITTENDSVRALELFKEDPGQFDLVFSDVTMPKMTGDQLLVEILAIRPDIPVILCTGYNIMVSEKFAKDKGAAAFVAKPMVKNILLNTIRSVLDQVGRPKRRKNDVAVGRRS